VCGTAVVAAAATVPILLPPMLTCLSPTLIHIHPSDPHSFTFVGIPPPLISLPSFVPLCAAGARLSASDIELVNT
jgi:hypothetical protein